MSDYQKKLWKIRNHSTRISSCHRALFFKIRKELMKKFRICNRGFIDFKILWIPEKVKSTFRKRSRKSTRRESREWDEAKKYLLDEKNIWILTGLDSSTWWRAHCIREINWRHGQENSSNNAGVTEATKQAWEMLTFKTTWNLLERKVNRSNLHHHQVRF